MTVPAPTPIVPGDKVKTDCTNSPNLIVSEIVGSKVKCYYWDNEKLSFVYWVLPMVCLKKV